MAGFRSMYLYVQTLLFSLNRNVDFQNSIRGKEKEKLRQNFVFMMDLLMQTATLMLDML